MSDLIHRFSERLGRRGLVLALFAIVFFLTGIKSFIAPSPDADRFMLYTMLPHWARGLLWCVPSLIGLYAAFTNKRGQNDGYGFSALAVPAVVLTMSYIISTVGFLFGLTDFSTGWLSAIQWGLILSLLLVTSGWTEVTHEIIRVIPINETEKSE